MWQGVYRNGSPVTMQPSLLAKVGLLFAPQGHWDVSELLGRESQALVTEPPNEKVRPSDVHLNDIQAQTALERHQIAHHGAWQSLLYRV